MKKLLFILFVFIGFSSYSQINMDEEMMNGSTLLLRSEMVLVYEVDYYGTHYDFIVTITGFEDGISFNYEMTNAAKTKGSIFIPEDAFQNSLDQYNYFSGGHVDLENMTSVWVSQKVYYELIKNGQSRISVDGGKNYVSMMNAVAGHDYEIDNKSSDEVFDDISYVYAASEDDQNKIWIHLSMYSPIILKMDIGWKIWLKEIKY